MQSFVRAALFSPQGSQHRRIAERVLKRALPAQKRCKPLPVTPPPNVFYLVDWEIALVVMHGEAAARLWAVPKHECDTCQDRHIHVAHVCYGGKPIEQYVHCVDCGGALAGQVFECH